MLHVGTGLQAISPAHRSLYVIMWTMQTTWTPLTKSTTSLFALYTLTTTLSSPASRFQRRIDRKPI